MFDLLIIDDTPAVRRQLIEVFGSRLSGYRVHEAADKAEGLRMLQAVSPNLVLLDLVMPSAAGARDADWTAGRDLLSAIRSGWPSTRVIVLTSEDTRVRQFLVEEGADDFFTKSDLRGPGLLKLIGSVEEAIGHFPCRAEPSALAWESLQAVRRADPVVLITGERGVGKRTTGRWLVGQWAPRDALVGEVDCARLLGLPPDAAREQLEASRTAWRVVTALEQAPLLPVATQQMLAGVFAAGSTGAPTVGVSREARDELTTHPGLQPALREVLLSARVIELSPLRTRGADLVELAETCCRRHARLAARAARSLDATAAEALLAYHEDVPWRRNLAELDELIAAAVGRTDGDEVTAADLGLEAGRPPAATEHTLVSIDIAGSTELKRGEPSDRVEASFKAFHRWVEEEALRYEGEVYTTSGDGVLLRFTTADAGVQCAIALVEGSAAFNEVGNQLSDDVAIRLGVHSGEVPAAPRSERGRVASPTLDVAAELQQSARPGEILVSAATYALLSHTGALRPLRVPIAGLQVYSI